MLRTGVLCCAVAGVLSLAVGCNLFSDSPEKKRDEAAAAMKVKLDEFDKKVADLKDKAGKATGEEKTKLEAKWMEAVAKQGEAKKKYEELKAAGADKWEVVKKDADKATDELKKAVE